MKRHELAVIEWVASVRGSGFVGACACGWESTFHRERSAALTEVTAHSAPSAPPAARPGRRLRFARRPVITAATPV